MESWEVIWADPEGRESRKEFPTYIQAWDFNEQTLRGRGEVVLLTDRIARSGRPPKSESEAVRQVEGVPRRKNR